MSMLFCRCKLSVGLLSGEHSQPPLDQSMEGQSEERRPKVCVCVRENGVRGDVCVCTTTGPEGDSTQHVQEPNWQRSC